MAKEIGGLTESILPSYEIVKRKIYFFWIEIQEELERYIFLKSKKSHYPIDRLSSKILTIYFSELRPKIYKKWGKIKKTKDENKSKDENNERSLFIKKMDLCVERNKIEEKDLFYVIQNLTDFLELSGLTNIGFEVVPFETEFSDSY